LRGRERRSLSGVGADGEGASGELSSSSADIRGGPEHDVDGKIARDSSGFYGGAIAARVDHLDRLHGSSMKSSTGAAGRCFGGGASPRVKRWQGGASVSIYGRWRREAARLRGVWSSERRKNEAMLDNGGCWCVVLLHPACAPGGRRRLTGGTKCKERRQTGGPHSIKFPDFK
jgi:hypothetical protein